MKRLLSIAVALLTLTACVDLDQTLTLHNNGSVSLLWRMGLPPEVTQMPWTKHGEERDTWWQNVVPPYARAFVTPSIEDKDGETALILNAELPDLKAYQDLRQAFTNKLAENSVPFPMFEPPMVRSVDSVRIVEVHLEPRENAPDQENDKRLGTHWTLHLVSDEPLTDHNADRVEPDGSLVWERTLGAVQREGLHTHATTRLNFTKAKTWLYVAISLVGILGAAIAFGIRKARASA